MKTPLDYWRVRRRLWLRYEETLRAIFLHERLTVETRPLWRDALQEEMDAILIKWKSEKEIK